MDRTQLAPAVAPYPAHPCPVHQDRRTGRAAPIPVPMPALALAAGLALALAACETVPPSAAPSAAAGLDSGPAQPFSANKGWTVTVHAPSGGKTYCQATRDGETVASRPRRASAPTAPAGTAAPVPNAPMPDTAAPPPGGLSLTFRTAAAESGFVLSGPAGMPGERYELTAVFDVGSQRTLSARALPDGALWAAVPSKSYLDEFEPFARAHRVTFRSAQMGELGVLLLSGTSWAINASDECRILKTER